MRILQLSDPHVRAPGNPLSGRVETLPFLERAISAVEQFRPRPDVVLITGDIVDLGSEEEYRLAKAALDRSSLPLFVLPGNHDERKGMRAALGRYLGVVPGEDCLAYAVDQFELRIVALDSVIPARGQGRLGEAQLAWLERTLSAQPDRPTLIALHHPPFVVGIAFMDRLGLLDRDEFSRVLAHHGQIVGVVAGHVHRTIVSRVGNIVGLVAPSTAHQIPLDLSTDGPETFVFEPPGFLLHEWDGEALRSHHVYLDDYGPRFQFG